jgi:hypothetical protein
MLFGVGIGVLGLMLYRFFKHDIPLVDLMNLCPFVYLAMLGYIMVPLLLAEFLSPWLPMRTVVTGIANLVIIAFYHLLYRAFPNVMQYPYIYCIVPSSFLFIQIEGYLQNDTLFGYMVLFNYAFFLLISLLYLWRMYGPKPLKIP